MGDVRDFLSGGKYCPFETPHQEKEERMSEESKQAQIKTLLDSCGNDQTKINVLDCVIEEVSGGEERMSEKWMRPSVAAISTIKALWDSHDALQAKIESQGEIIKTLEARVWELRPVPKAEIASTPPYEPIGQPNPTRDMILKFQTKVKELQDEIEAYDRAYDYLSELRSDALIKAERLRHWNHFLDRTLCDQQATIREQQNVIERKSSTNRNASKLIEGHQQEISELKEENAKLRKQEDACSFTGLVMQNIKLIEKNKSLVLRNRELVTKRDNSARDSEVLITTNCRLGKESKALITRIESLKAVIGDAVCTLKGSYAFGATPLRLIESLKGAL